ncbi:helix-turn-helix domain-containing protein [uncultured Planktomarina sp.]
MCSKDLAAEIGQSQRPRIRYFGKICRALHCQPGDLLEFLDVSTRADK